MDCSLIHNVENIVLTPKLFSSFFLCSFSVHFAIRHQPSGCLGSCNEECLIVVFIIRPTTIVVEWPERIMEYPPGDLPAGFSPGLVPKTEVKAVVDSNINQVLLDIRKAFIGARVWRGQRVITRDCNRKFIGPKKESHGLGDARRQSVCAG